MPNRFRLRANIDRLWRRATGSLPAYIRLKALNAVAREIYPSNDRTRANYQMYLATDPYDVARHKLRDLYDHATPEASLCLPLPLGEGRGEGSADSSLPPPDGGGRCLLETEGGLPPDEQLPEEDDDPL